MSLTTLAPPPPTVRPTSVFGPQLPTITDYKAAAQRGASLLDQHRPDWARSIHLQNLSLGDPNYCVLGQLFFTYGLGLTTLFGPNIVESHRGTDLPTWYGFDSAMEHNFELDRGVLPGFRALTDMWAIEVAVRRMGV